MNPTQESSESCSELTPRQRREREYYDEYVARHHVEEVDFAPVLSDERRPWNSYWYLYGRVRDLAEPGAKTLLDIGCGFGVDSVRYAKLGYHVQGIDISPGNIQETRHLAERYGVQDRVQAQTMAAESLSFPDESFDVVAGVDVLHHIEIDKAIPEVMRVLKPGGVALFKECVELPGIDNLYLSLVGRLPGKRQVSADCHMTQDERKLNRHDLAVMRAACPKMVIRRFMLFSRFSRFFKPRSNEVSRLEQLDWRLIQTFPPMGRLAGWAVFELPK